MAENIAFEQNLRLDTWQNGLDAYSNSAEQSFMDALAFGMSVSENAAWSPEVQSIHEALGTLDMLYHTTHRAIDAGSYHYEKTGEHSATIVCDTSYPGDFNYGILYGIILKFRDETSSQVVVRRDNDQEDHCTYHLAW